MVTPEEHFASYVPAVVARGVAVDPTPRGQPRLEHFPAATLFADIAGFTPLASRLAERGPAGAEELGRILNTYFSRLLALVDAHGGEAVKFAGDALLAWWPVSPDEDLSTAVCRASQCGLAVQAALDATEAGAGIRLSLHVGIGAGEALGLHVGGVGGRWYFLAAGEPVRQSGAAVGQAHAGEVVLAPEAWALVRERSRVEPREAGCVRLEAIRNPPPPRAARPGVRPAAAQAALDAYVPTPIRARLAAGHAEWLAELRRVSVLFLGLLDLDQTTPDALGQAQAVLAAVQPIFDRYEGFIKELVVDDKGATIVALFGLPPQAHEDDAARCVRTAQAVQAALAVLGQRTALGVTTGRAFCGAVGSDLRREYTVVGEVMNVAARLMGQAADTILCDAATAAAAGGRLAFEALPAILVKGRPAPLSVYRPHGLAAAPTGGLGPATDGDQPLVGRTAERMALGEALADLHGGTGAVVILEGDAGLGKSRLVGDLLAQAAARQLPALVGAADAIEQATSYYAWRPVVSRLLGLETLGGASPDAQRAHVLEQLQDDPALARLAPLLSSIVAIDLPDSALTRAMTGEVRADNTRDLVVLLLRRAMAAAPHAATSEEADPPTEQPRPHLLVLEDAHWLDSASWALARQVAEQARPLLLVLATRPLSEPLPPDYQRLKNTGEARTLRLAALEADETVALVGQRLGVAALPEPVARLIVERAEGNPFFSEELALALRDAGVITVADGTCRLAPGAGDLRGLVLPDTVQGVITSRIDRLTPRQQLALKVASVIGRVFAHHTLRDVHPVAADRSHLVADLQVLERQDLTVLETPEPGLAYLFKHVITQETAYSLLPFAQRRELHRVVAGWIERRESSDLAPYYPLLAYHWGRAEDAARTVDYLELAGEQALRQSAYQEAVGFLTEALRLDAAGNLGNDRLRRARWQHQLGAAHLGLGSLAESRANLERALALLGQPVPTTRLGLITSLTGQVLRQVLHRAWPVRWSGPPRPPSATALEAARAEGRLGEVLYFAHEQLPTLHSVIRTLNRVEGAEPSAELARAYVNACVGAGLVPLHALAQTYGRLGLETARHVGDPSAICWVLLITGMYQLGVGEWASARAAIAEATEIAERLGDRRRQDECRNLVGVMAFYQGTIASTARLSTELQATARRRGDIQMELAALHWLVEHALAAGTADEAVALAEEAVVLAAGNADRLEQLVTRGLLGLARMRRGEQQLALQAADEAARLIAMSAPMGPWTRDAYAAVAEVYLTHWALGHHESARPARQACAALRQFARVFPIGETTAGLCQGRVEWLEGRPARAMRAWQRSLAAAERLGLALDQGWAHYEIGRHRPAHDPTGLAHLERARAIFEQTGALYHLARVDEALGDRRG